jgi:hypothetical protein
VKLVICSFLLITTFLAASAQRINTDAVVRFWRVVDHLEEDRPLDDSLWNTYYNLRGNRTYMENNRYLNQPLEHRKCLEFVFRPSLADSLRLLQAADTIASDDILDNLLYIKANEQQLRSYTRLVISPIYLQQCIKLAKQYLPKNKLKPIPQNLTIYIMAMTFDAAVQDSSMYFGMARVYEYDKYREGALAGHELHHQLRVDSQIREKVSSADSAVFETVDEINNEGCADLIDKMLLLENPGKIFRGANTVHRLMDDAARTIIKLDSCFKVNATATNTYVTGRQFDRITNYSSGHLPGLYMVDIIQRNGFKDRLIASNDNPFQFFYLYNEAAKKDPARPPLFSIAAIAYLKQLEKRSL